MFNISALVEAVGRKLEPEPQLSLPVHLLRRQVASDPVLLQRLPSRAFLLREAEALAPKSLVKHLERTTLIEEDLDSSTSPEIARSPSVSSEASASSFRSWKSFMKQKAGGMGISTWKEPQPFEILRAVEKKDLVFLMEVRDKAFKLLLQKTGDTTPLLHAMRIGQSHREVAIVLLGAFSRWINHLEDSDMKKPETRPLLKALRTNLKLAIDYGLAKSQSELIASFLQTLIMSEGDRWVHSQVATLTSALRAPGSDGKPVRTADTAVRRFATRELGKAELIATLEDYVANATVDLLMMAAWALASAKISADPNSVEPIPAWYFARDDRVYKAFIDRLERYQVLQTNAIGKRLKSQLTILSRVLEGRATTYRSKVETLRDQFDEEAI